MRSTSGHRWSLHAFSICLSAVGAALLGGASVQAQSGLPHYFKAPPGSVYFGGSIAGGGDADNDSHDDVFIMDPDYEENGVAVGRVFMYSGRTRRELWRVTGTQRVHTYNGWRYFVAAFIGDIDGDGCDDVALGQPTASETRGRIEVFSGRSGAPIYSFVGDEIGNLSGRDIAGAGDTNGDGTPDFAYVARWTEDGRVSVRSGRDGSEILSIERPFPRRVRGAGDIDRDGRADLAIGSWQSDRSGIAIAVISGADGSMIHDLGRPRLDDDQFGWTLAAGHDLNGDGVPDLVATGRFSSPQSKARVYLIDGRTGDAATFLAPMANVFDSTLGYAIGLGDVNGDGVIEALVADISATFIFDSASRTLLSWSAPIDRGSPRSIFGSELAIGDVNADGFDDIITRHFASEGGGVIARAGAPILLAPYPPQFSWPLGSGFVVQHGVPGQRLYLLGSQRGAACNYITRFDVCLNLAPPVLLLGRAVTNAGGAAGFLPDLRNLPLDSIWLQVVDPNHPKFGAATSNVVVYD